MTHANGRLGRRLYATVGFAVTAALLAVGLVTAPSTAVAVSDDEVWTPDPGVTVEGKDVGPLKASPITDVPAPDARRAALPTGGAATVPVVQGEPGPVSVGKAATSEVGGLPVRITQRERGSRDGAVLDDLAVEVHAPEVEDSSASLLLSLSRTEADRSKAATSAIDGGATKRAGADPGPSAVESVVDVAVNYSSFSGLHGGSWSDRLTLVQVPACALETPEKAKCQGSDPVVTDNRTADDTLIAKNVAVPADGSPMALAVATSVSGDKGTFGATPLSPSNTWSTDLRSGSFSWSYPITSPDVPGSFVPTLGLSYSSGGIDGRTSSTNNQASLVGDGFDLWPGYIERKYKSCALDEEKNADGGAIGDLCWDYDNAFISFNGAAGELVSTGSGTWKLQKDDGTKIERLTNAGRGNGDNDNEYWKVTTSNGTQYFFGYNRLPGWVTGDPETNSVWTVPVLGNDAGEPCSANTGKWCHQAWRWNLDYAIDPAGNKINYRYTEQINRYGRLGDPAASTEYTRGGTLDRIVYGLRGDDLVGAGAAQPLGRVLFSYGERCLSDGSGQCDAIGTQPNGWHDTPWDLNCAVGATCNNGRTSPSFWIRHRMTNVSTSVYADTGSGAGWKNVDSWAFGHEWGTSDSDYQLLLNSITRTGHTGPTGAATITTPPVTLGYIQLQNRLDRDGDGQDPFVKKRLMTVVDEVGGQVDVDYSAFACNAGGLPTPQTNTTRCFPQKRKPGPNLDPVTDWFSKYVVDKVIRTDRSGQALDSVTDYTYVGDAAWHWDESTGMIPAEEKTWSDWRGYEHVRVQTGESGSPASRSEHWFLRGMNGDRADSSGGTKSVQASGLEEGEGDAIVDRPYWAGHEYKSATFTGPGGQVVSKSVSRPWWLQTGISQRAWGTIRAGFTGTAQTRGFQSMDDGGAPWRTTQADTTHDPDTGRVTQVDDQGDTSVSTDDRCSKIVYADNTVDNILGLQSRNQTWAVGCSSSPDRAGGDVINDVRYAYDYQGYGVAPVRGRVTRAADFTALEGTTAVYLETASAFDTYGRPTSVTQAAADVRVTDFGTGALTRTTRSDGSTSTTAYTPSTGFATQMVETTPPATPGNVATALKSTTVLDPVRGGPTKVTDTNSKATNVTYDALGRTSKIWLADRLTSQTPSTAFTYRMNGTDPVAVGTTTLNNNGDPRTSWTIYDGLLRQVQTQDPGPDGGLILADTHYDARGLVSRTYNPYYTTSATGGRLFDPYGSAVVDGQVRNVYDGLGRITQSRLMRNDGDGGEVMATTRTAYYGNKVTTVPPIGGTATTTVTDARGRTTQLRQHHDRATAAPTDTTGFDTTSYTHTGRDELATVTDPAGNVWEYSYDQRGRQTRTVDPDAGVTTSTYDVFNQVTSTTDSAGLKLVNLYDGLGRRTELRENSDTGALRASWTYDTVTGAKGQLAASTRYEGDAQYTNRTVEYDNLYRPTRTVAMIPSVEGELAGNYQTATTYDPDGSVSGISLSSAGSLPGQTIAYEIDPNTSWVTGLIGTGDISSASQYDSVGRLTQVVVSAGTGQEITTGYSYDRTTDRLVQFRADRLSEPGIDRWEDYTYDQAGNITSLADVSRTGTDVQCFDLDYLSRITDAWTQDAAGCAATGQNAADTGLMGGAAPYWHEYTYDKVGSRIEEVQHSVGGQRLTNRSYSYDAEQPHTVTSVNQVQPVSGSLPRVESVEQYGYDPTGQTTTRQIGGDTQNLTWNPEGRVQEIENADGSQAEYLYDADGNRLIARNTNADGSSEQTLYLGHTEITVTSAEPTVAKATRYIDVGGGHVAVIDDTGAVTFVLADHHGTGQLSIGAADMAISQRRTTPFGQERGSSSPGPDQWASSRGFVGGYDDREVTGLISVGAREYDPDLGRFISLDPLMDLTDPQQIHGYTYGNNNPVAVADPSGLGYEECHTGQYTCHRGSGMTITDVTPDPDYDGGNTDEGDGGGYDNSGPGGSATNAGNPGPATQGPTAAEIAKAKAIQSKSIADVAMELGWEALKDFVGWNDLMGCLDKDVASCAMLAVGIIPVGKGLKAVKALGKLVEGAIDFYKQQKAARRILDQAGAARKAPSCNSFVPGTLVLLADGTSKPIEEIELGDEVLAADEDMGKGAEGRPVTALIRSEGDKTLVTITVTAADGDTQQIAATDAHPFWVPDLREWVDAIDLIVGDWLQTSAGTWAQVTAIDVERKRAVVHNVTVATDHTYYVAAGRTASAVLVHNDSCPLLPSDEARAVFDKQLKKYGKDGYKVLESGRVRFYGKTSPAANPGEMVGRRMVREWDPSTGAKRIWHETLDGGGTVRIVRPDVNVTGGAKVHYVFDQSGQFTGRF
jgi:RHS repeat-associated protein